MTVSRVTAVPDAPARRWPFLGPAHRDVWLVLLAGALGIAGLAALLIVRPSAALAGDEHAGVLALAACAIGLAALRLRPRPAKPSEPPDAEGVLALQQQVGRYRALFESVSDTLFGLDARGRFVYASPTVLSLLGVSPQAIVGRSIFDFIAAHDVGEARRHALAFRRSSDNETRQRLYDMVTADGLLRHVEMRYGRPFAGDTDGTVAVGVLRDVSVAFTMTRRLREERQRLRSIVDASGALILLVDRDLTVRLANQELRQLRRADGAGGEAAADIVTAGLDPAILARWRAGKLSRQDAQPVRFTLTLPDGAGADRVLAVTAKPVVGADRCLRQIVFLGVDDTERQAAERALHDADRLATLGEMAATVVHELRQPLQVIMMACESALDEPHETALVVEKLGAIDRQVERANHIIEDLRVFARGTGGERPQPFDAAQAVTDAIGITAAAARHAGLTIEPVLARDLPKVLGHAGKLEQVLINLINNARDAGARDLRIAAALRATDDGARRFIDIVVDDDGPGITPAVLARLFTAFVTTKPSGKGTGLGLRICRRIVEEMGGTIGASNRPEGGARFVIALPAA
ncbi:MAG: PAS domain S-box protein [Alphaproteobacteria bacterium]|nr:PAS domain S-box protein [Alphaproteobacteria bacterium]